MKNRSTEWRKGANNLWTRPYFLFLFCFHCQIIILFSMHTGDNMEIQKWIVNKGERYNAWLKGGFGTSGTQAVVPEPKDFTIVLTLAPKLLDAIFFPGTWKGFETASTYAAWNFLKNWENGMEMRWNSFFFLHRRLMCTYANGCTIITVHLGDVSHRTYHPEFNTILIKRWKDKPDYFYIKLHE